MSGTLLHICCAPCSIACIDTLRQEGIEPVGFWYNPNIHPMKEYKMRKNTLVEYAKSIDLKLEIENEYGLRRFIEAVYPNWDNRCATCYALRFEETARYAAEHGYDQFTSTLFVSPYQNHELMRQICEQMAEKYGVEYLHRDFSPRFREGQDKGEIRQGDPVAISVMFAIMVLGMIQSNRNYPGRYPKIPFEVVRAALFDPK